MEDLGYARAKRETAARVRRLSLGVSLADQKRILALAAALEAEAEALERLLQGRGDAVAQAQMQVQQGPPAGRDQDNEGG